MLKNLNLKHSTIIKRISATLMDSGKFPINKINNYYGKLKFCSR